MCCLNAKAPGSGSKKFSSSRSSWCNDKNWMRLTMQPAIQLVPSHLLQNIGTAITVRLLLFLPITSTFARAVLLLNCTQKLHPSNLDRDTNCPQVCLWLCSSNSVKFCHNKMYWDGLLQRSLQLIICQPYRHWILYNLKRKFCFESH